MTQDVSHGTVAPLCVVIPTFDRRLMLKECIESLLAQSNVPAQIVVVIDGSTDGTDEMLAEYGARVEVTRTRGGIGKGGACNIGLKHVSQPFLWFFDDDDVVVPGAVERLLAPLIEDDNLGFVVASHFYAYSKPDGTIGVPHWESPVPPFGDRGLFQTLLVSNFLSGGSVLLRTSVARELGGFDETYLRSQDYEYVLRLSRRYEGKLVAGGPVYYMRQHAGLRGTRDAQFSARDRAKRWLEYDQRLFRSLRTHLGLEEYVPRNVTHGVPRRTALLFRARIMAGKLLLQEAAEDIQAGAIDQPDVPLAPAEMTVLGEIVALSPYYEQGSPLSDPEFLPRLLRNLPRSLAGRQIRRRILMAMLRQSLRAVKHRQMTRSWVIAERVVQSLRTG